MGITSLPVRGLKRATKGASTITGNELRNYLEDHPRYRIVLINYGLWSVSPLGLFKWP